MFFKLSILQYYVYSPDTDVFVASSLQTLFDISYFFRMGQGDNIRDINFCCLALTKTAKAILGFHTFTGCDQTG